jgi:PAS domain S-box-containing protein
MSEHLQNREYRAELLKGLLADLHKGRDLNEVKREFARLVDGVGATEIADIEQRLIEEGMDPAEIKKMCDVHAAVFRDSLAGDPRSGLPAGHPLHTLKDENNNARNDLAAIEKYLDKLAAGTGDSPVIINDLRERTKSFYRNIDRHFSKKENIFFPYLEKHGITGPPSVMWSVDDEIREMVKGFSGTVEALSGENAGQLTARAQESFNLLQDKLNEMFFKEEEILSSMLADTLGAEEWADIQEQSADFGDIFSVRPVAPAKTGRAAGPPTTSPGDSLALDTGQLTPGQINAILTNLPLDITFVDSNDQVKYFSQGKERIFTRTKSIIGRKVQNCHPPESVHMVEKIVNDFKTGRHSGANFWLELNGRFIHIQYTALRDESGQYLGTMEVSQDITPLRNLEGERRLLQYSH